MVLQLLLRLASKKVQSLAMGVQCKKLSAEYR